MKKICKQCGKEFETDLPKKQKCDDCIKLNRYQSKKKYYHANKEQICRGNREKRREEKNKRPKCRRNPLRDFGNPIVVKPMPNNYWIWLDKLHKCKDLLTKKGMIGNALNISYGRMQFITDAELKELEKKAIEVVTKKAREYDERNKQ